jgi:hypothetical protein
VLVADNDPIAWRAIVYGTPVLASDGTKAGEVREVLGSDGEDIFHGVRLERAGGHADVVVVADDITTMTSSAIQSVLTTAELAALPPYVEEASFHVGSVGRFRKHLGWKQDSESDEEPG